MKKNIEIIIFVIFVRYFFSYKVRDHCNLTGKNRGPAHQNLNKNVTQKQNIFFHFFHKFCIHDCHQFLKKVVDKKKESVKFVNISKTNEENLSVTYGCVGFNDS